MRLRKLKVIKIEILDLGSHLLLKLYLRSGADSPGGNNAESAAQLPCPWKLGLLSLLTLSAKSKLQQCFLLPNNQIEWQISDQGEQSPLKGTMSRVYLLWQTLPVIFNRKGTPYWAEVYLLLKKEVLDLPFMLWKIENNRNPHCAISQDRTLCIVQKVRVTLRHAPTWEDQGK